MKKIKNVRCVEAYPSATTLLEISIKEYEHEKERSNTLDTKASFFLSVSIAVLTIFIPIIPFSELTTFFATASTIYLILVTIALCLLLVSIIFFIMSTVNLYSAYKLRNFKNINFENLNDENILKTPKNQTECGLVHHYNSVLVYNVDANNEKASKINVGLKYSVLSFSFLFASAILLIILIGG